MGDVSMELCGGTHVSRTGEIGPFRILSESSVAAGIRRIEAATGIPAYETIRSEHIAVSELSRIFNASPGDMAERAEALAAKVRDLEKQVRKLKAGGGGSGADILSDARKVNGVSVACGRQEAVDVDELKTLADSVRARIGSGVGILGAEIEGKVSIVVVVTDDLIATRSLKAGDIVKRFASVLEGSGGGRPHMAMAGGKDPAKLDAALAAAPGIVGELMKG
jgi:alanyl-tRNA synthetase